MKSKILGLLTFCVLAVGSPLHSDSDAFGNFFSISSQPLNLNDPVTFDLDLAEKNVSISGDRKSIIIQRKGFYHITFAATGSLSDAGTQEVGPWSLGLFRNNGLIVGTISATTSGTDAEDNLEANMVYGQAIFRCNPGDQLQIRSTTTDPIAIIGTVSGGTHQNTSCTLAVVLIDAE